MNPFDPPSRGDENPYAPPETDLRERHDRTLTAITGFEPVEPFSIDNVMRRSWRIYQKRLGITLAIVIGVWALNVGYQIFSSLLLLGLTGGDVHSPVSGPLQIVLGIAGYALSFFLTAGQAVALLRLARNRDASLGDVFGAGRYFWRMLGATLLIGLLMIPITFVCRLPVLIGVAATSGVQEVGVRAVVIIGLSLIGIVGAFAITTRLFQYLYVLVDDDCGAFGMHSAIRRFDARTRRRIVPHQHSRNAHRPLGNPGVRRRTHLHDPVRLAGLSVRVCLLDRSRRGGDGRRQKAVANRRGVHRLLALNPLGESVDVSNA